MVLLEVRVAEKHKMSITTNKEGITRKQGSKTSKPLHERIAVGIAKGLVTGGGGDKAPLRNWHHFISLRKNNQNYLIIQLNYRRRVGSMDYPIFDSLTLLNDDTLICIEKIYRKQ